MRRPDTKWRMPEGDGGGLRGTEDVSEKRKRPERDEGGQDKTEELCEGRSKPGINGAGLRKNGGGLRGPEAA